MIRLASTSLRLSIIAIAFAFLFQSAHACAQTPSLLEGFSSSSSSEPNSAVSPSAPAPAPAPITHPHVETSFSLGVFAQLTATRITSPDHSLVTESLTPSAGVLGTFRQSFRPWLGYSINMGYTRASEHYTNNAGLGSAGTASNFSIPANIYELSASYVAEKHLTPRLSGFADVGAGMVVFLPENGEVATPGEVTTANTHALFTNYRPEGVGGVGFDYKLSGHLGLRAEYRGQLYKYADYGNLLPRNYTVTSEPTFSLTYNFGGAKK